MARTGEFVWTDGRFEEAMSRMLAAYEVLADQPDEAVAQLASQIGRIAFFLGDTPVALEWLERALSLAERLLLPEVLSMAMNTKAVMLWGLGRKEEGELLMTHALEVGLQARPSAPDVAGLQQPGLDDRRGGSVRRRARAVRPWIGVGTPVWRPRVGVQVPGGLGQRAGLSGAVGRGSGPERSGQKKRHFCVLINKQTYTNIRCNVIHRNV